MSLSSKVKKKHFQNLFYRIWTKNPKKALEECSKILKSLKRFPFHSKKEKKPQEKNPEK